jgi:hypothetical protein
MYGGLEGAVSAAVSDYLCVGAMMIQDAAKAPLKGAISTADDVKLALPNASDEVVSEILERTNQAQSKAQTRVKSTNKIYDAYTSLIQYIYTLYEKDDE